MKAAFINAHGDIGQIQVGSVDTPKPKPTELLVECHFGALNHLDIFVTKGWAGLNLKMPHILGSDGAGIVKEVGSEVSTFKAGDKIAINPGISCGKCALCLAGQQNLCRDYSIKGEHPGGGGGTFAEYFTIPEINAIKLPDVYPLDQAAAASLTFLTSWRMLVTKAQVKPGDIVLIQGASGGVATASIQIAKMFNAKVIVTTSSAAKAQKAKELGADFVIDYKATPDYSKIVFKDYTDKRGVDIVIDSVGAATFNTSLRLLRQNGKLVTCGATTSPTTELDIRQIFWKQLEILGSTMSNQTEFRDVMRFVIEGKLHPIIDKVFPLDQAREAEAYLRDASQFGKVLLKIK